MTVNEPVSSVLKRRVVKSTTERRRDILDAALALFSDQGFHETTVEDVAQTAGVAKGTIYLYFDSKEHILLALKRRFMSGLTDELTDVIADGLSRFSRGEGVDYRDVIDSIFEQLIGYHCRHRDAVEVVVRQSPGPDLVADVLELEDEFVDLIAGTFDQARETGLIDVTDPEMTARLVNAAIRDNLATCLCYGEPEDLDRLVRAAKELLYKALSPDVQLPPRRPRLVHTSPEPARDD